MTERLYYEDSYRAEFDACIIERRRAGSRPAVVLDRTAFYATSGGQPNDLGVLAGVPVLDVLEEESGAILHIMAEVLAAEQVHGRIDWERRFDHMQQHTGQHILSQAFIQTARASTLSFHLGQDTCTIDIDLQQPSASLIQEAENLSTRIVFESRPVIVRTVDKTQLASLEIRKETLREGPIRVVEVEGFDRSACGGTHVRRTSEVGMVAVTGFEKYKGGTRVEFICGGRVLATLRREHQLLWETGRIASLHPSELPQLITRLLEERAALTREISHLREEQIEAEAAAMVASAERHGGVAIMRRVYTKRSLDSIKLLARKVAARDRVVAIFALGGETAQVVAARSADLRAGCGAAIQQTTARLGGRGGGRPEMAQAGGIPAEKLEQWMAELEEFFLRALALSS